jgi:ABC-type glycerol-3-phosphate transport system substrate-binding protein
MGIFVMLVIVGVGVFSLFGGIGGKAPIGPVVIWGTIDQGAMDKVLGSLTEKDKTLQDAVYIAHKPETYQGELINAIAAGTGPDLVMLSQSTIGTLSDKISPIPYSAVSQSDFLSSYIDEGQLFMAPQGILALPFSIDPLVMYWNRDTFTSAGEAKAPQHWNDLIALAPKITSLDAGSNVRRSLVAMGTWDNISNAKAILSALMMQSGDFITGRDEAGALTATLGVKPDTAAVAPASEALRFYTDFANPSKTTYSWNRSLPNSYNAFASGDVALYFGFASEYRAIAERNPNLRFGVAVLPQLQGASAKITSGAIQGLAVARGAKNPGGALIVAQKLTTAAAAAAVAQTMGLPPVRRDVGTDTSASAASAVFVQSALMSRSWADPNAAATDSIFKSMIESVSSGRSTPEQAVFDAASALRQLLPNI